ncbi:MAG: hypothetical protein PHU21_11780 [Elusimicrobia bacterium]|nr:hypothetical protein [Elusimicrobiota bacterium]
MTMRRGVWLSWLGLICLCGLALRWQKSREPVLFARPDYKVLADNLVSHRLLGENDEPSAFRSPLFPSFIALTRESWFPLRLPFPRWQALISASAVPAAAGLGLLAHSPLAGLLTALLVALDPRLIAEVPSYNLEPFFGLLVLAVCAALLCWQSRPKASRAVLAGAAVALSLLCRSTLFLLPPFLLAVFACSADLRRLRRGAALLLAASYLLLAPWAVRNYGHFQAFLPFEQGAAARNLYAASLGYVENTAGYGYQDVLAGRLDTAPLASPGPVERMRDMALAEIRERPLAYLGSTLRRLVLALGVHWVLWPLACLFLFWKRREPRAQLLGAVALYFFVVHSPMSWERRYFEPALPCLDVLAACAAAEAWRRARRGPSAGPAPAVRTSGRPGPAELPLPPAPAVRTSGRPGPAELPLPPARPPGWLAPALAGAVGTLHPLCAGYLAGETAWLRWPCRMPASALSLLRCAEAQAGRGDKAAAAAGLRRAQSLPADDPDIRARILIDQALLGGDRGLLDQAMSISSQTVRQQAIALQGERKYPEASLLMDRLVALGTRRTDALTVRGAQRTLAGQPRPAWQDLSRAVALDPADIAARVNLGSLLESRGRCREALEQYRRAVSAAESLPEERIPGFYLALARHYRDRLEQGRGPAACRKDR